MTEVVWIGIGIWTEYGKSVGQSLGRKVGRGFVATEEVCTGIGIFSERSESVDESTRRTAFEMVSKIETVGHCSDTVAEARNETCSLKSESTVVDVVDRVVVGEEGRMAVGLGLKEVQVV